VVKKLIRLLFFLLIIRPIVLIIIGLRVSHQERLPRSGPAIIVANHNSHLDTLVLMSLFPLKLLDKLRPVAARDYFMKNKFLAWLAIDLIGILPIDRQNIRASEHKLNDCYRSLDRGDILIIYPEGSRGEPEFLAAFKSGIAHIAKSRPDVKIYPVFLHGLGKILPKGDIVLVPFFCDILVGEPIDWTGNKKSFMDLLEQQMRSLADSGYFPPWE
jgi:1-acyl-sn-glycerol-3-phosphate acyltransferase